MMLTEAKKLALLLINMMVVEANVELYCNLNDANRGVKFSCIYQYD